MYSVGRGGRCSQKTRILSRSDLRVAGHEAGFGRLNLVTSLTKSPATFTVGLADPTDDDHAKQIVRDVLASRE